jgi:hypothetical protein
MKVSYTPLFLMLSAFSVSYTTTLAQNNSKAGSL